MKTTCSRLLALGVVLALAGTAHAGGPAVTSLLLPQLFGQDAAPAPAVQPVSPKSEAARKRIVVSTSELDGDEDCLADLVWDGVSACRMMLMPSRYEGVAALLEVLARIATDKYVEANADAALAPAAPPCPKKTAIAPSCETLHPPKQVSGPACSSWAIRVAVPDGMPGCCAGAAKGVAADKACKCCESCKDCQCGKKTTAARSCNGSGCGAVVVNERNFSVEPIAPTMTYMPQRMAAPCQPLLMHLLPPNAAFHPMPTAASMPPHPLLPPPPPPQLVRALIGETPSCLMAELHELVQQRDLIAHAIDQVEMEIARLAQQKQIEQAQVAAQTPKTQKVHLVTKSFEAHCDSLIPVGGAPHCLVLQGNVRLTCKKGGEPIRIEAPCITINVQDGTFSVCEPASCPSVPASAQRCVPPAVTPAGASSSYGSGR